jgi:hypothetical protein
MSISMSNFEQTTAKIAAWNLAGLDGIPGEQLQKQVEGLAISQTYSTEYIRGSLRIFPMHWCMNIGRERFRRDVSDHLPLAATLRIDRAGD